ncbi:MAG: alcohol dehydrogenase [Desulfobulbaceae bacterium DB1]|nr:MAG: alcohol dehydrogenase [Desulfobulbaceae bacterium DB1]
MQAMVLKKIGLLRENEERLALENLAVPQPAENELLIRVSACGVCHTELDEIEGRTPPPRLPVVLGHQVIGRIHTVGAKVTFFQPGDRVGVGWIFSACGSCRFCRTGNENLCPDFKATGRDFHGGYAEYMTAPESSCFAIPDIFSDIEAAPLLCAGAIGFRSLRLTGLTNGMTLGLCGFGASAHLVLHLARHLFPASRIFVFARSVNEQKFALALGATWAGDIGDKPPLEIDRIIDTTPAWKPVITSLAALSPGGRLVINAIRKEEADKNVLLQLDYPAHLWQEKEIKSVANVSRTDIRQFLELAAAIPIRPEVRKFALRDANIALAELKARNIRGAKVLFMHPG